MKPVDNKIVCTDPDDLLLWVDREFKGSANLIVAENIATAESLVKRGLGKYKSGRLTLTATGRAYAKLVQL